MIITQSAWDMNKYKPRDGTKCLVLVNVSAFREEVITAYADKTSHTGFSHSNMHPLSNKPIAWTLYPSELENRP